MKPRKPRRAPGWPERVVDVELIGGVEDPSIAINNFRVAGPKPWGGGRVLRRWTGVRERDVLYALGLGYPEDIALRGEHPRGRPVKDPNTKKGPTT